VTVTEDQFNSQWRSIIGDYFGLPACPGGMALLRDFADRYPTLLRFVRPKDFINLDREAFYGIQEWETFAEHVLNCPNCNKSDEANDGKTQHLGNQRQDED